MVSLNCPICRSEISGKNEQDLSISLQNHMVKEHLLKDPCDLGVHDSTKRACKPSASGDLESLPYERRMEIEKHPSPADQFLGEDVMQTVRCPICGDTLLGHTSEDLSFNVEAHIASMHRVRPGKGKEAFSLKTVSRENQS